MPGTTPPTITRPSPPPPQALVELPYVTLQAALYSVVTFFMIEFVATAARFFWYFFFTWLW